LIVDYLALVDELCTTLDEVRLPVALKLANLPDEIRGFGHVKERNMLAAQQKQARLLDEYRATQQAAAAAVAVSA
jgi:indolepyruvate ferredoxin oxidoreductase